MASQRNFRNPRNEVDAAAAEPDAVGVAHFHSVTTTREQP